MTMKAKISISSEALFDNRIFMKISNFSDDLVAGEGNKHLELEN